MGMRDQLEDMLAAGRDGALLRFSLGELLYQAGETGPAITHLAEAVAQDPQYSAAWKLYGRALLEHGDTDAAIDALERGIAVAEHRGDNQAAKEMRVFLKRARRRDSEGGN